MKKLFSLLAAGLVLAAAPLAAAQDYGPFNHHHAWGEGWGGMLFGPMMMIVFLAVAVMLVILAFRWLAGAGSGAGQAAGGAGRASPLDVLKDRFARGEIDKQEYEERRRVLSD